MIRWMLNLSFCLAILPLLICGCASVWSDDLPLYITEDPTAPCPHEVLEVLALEADDSDFSSKEDPSEDLEKKFLMEIRRRGADGVINLETSESAHRISISGTLIRFMHSDCMRRWRAEALEE